MRRRERRDAEEHERRVPELLEPRFPAGEQRRQLQRDGEEGRRRGEERVHQDSQLGGDVDDAGGEHAGDQGVQAPPRDGAEEALELAVVPAQQLEGLEERGLAGADDVGGRDRREDVEGDGRVGGGDAVDVDDAVIGRAGWWLGDHHGDVVAVAEEEVGELHHGYDVPDAGAGVQDDGLLLHRHGFLLRRR
uniref:Uncharacterized protein n=1 Tax=Arundo donax TaxID=35708 RepID=A0A0A9EJL2_ARUDO